MKKPCRDRVIVFRVDADEFAALEAAQRKSTARNISDYCRQSIVGNDLLAAYDPDYQPEARKPDQDQRALWAIEQICGDDFCEEMDMRDATGDLNGDLQCAAEKLSAIYRIAHAFLRSHTCFHVHEDWRAEIKAKPLHGLKESE